MKTNWQILDKKISQEKNHQAYGTIRAQMALEEILGNEWVEQAVEHAISASDNSNELAINCLSLLASSKAADYAYSIYKSAKAPHRKSMAVWVIKNLRVPHSFDWIEEFLNDQDAMQWGLAVLDQLLWCHVVDYESEKVKVDRLLKMALENSDGLLEENVVFIQNYLSEDNH